MSTETTYELEITLIGAEAERPLQKEYLTAWLVSRGFDTFVEEVVDNLDLFPDEYESWQAQEHGMSAGPILLHSFQREVMEQLGFDVESAFAGHVRCQIREQATQQWQEGWKDAFTGFACGSFWVTPPWEEAPATSTLLRIDPGLAFGTGQHATTQLCLSAIEPIAQQITPAESSLLDVGCGSGILAIAACKLGFARVEACDIDANAISATEHNAALNEVHIPVIQGSIEQYPPNASFTCIVANILFPVLQVMLPDLLARLAPTGYLLLSGIITEQAQPLLKLGEKLGLKLTERRTQEDWEVLVLRRL